MVHRHYDNHKTNYERMHILLSCITYLTNGSCATNGLETLLKLNIPCTYLPILDHFGHYIDFQYGI